MLEKYIQDVIKLSSDTLKEVDEINKRLITAIIVMMICFAITIISIAYFYFTTDYNYGTNQTQINTDGSIQTTKGGK